MLSAASVPFRRSGPPVTASVLRALLPWVSGLMLTACGTGGPPQLPPPAVSVAAVVQKPVTEWDPYEGRITAIESVELRPRVSGYLAGVHYREGSRVAKGALLFTVDDREYRAALDSARAGRAISDEELESRRGELRQAEADLAAARAQERQAALNVEFTRITAPIAGVVSSARVRPGNLVNAGQTLLTTVVSVDPIYVEFEGDERMYLRYQAMARRGERPSSRDARNQVRVGLADEEGYPHQGEMVFVDNALDPGTGTIRARAQLSNKDGFFTPGLFARVQLQGGGPRDALLINERAVLTDQDRKYVYVVDNDNLAQRRDVVLGARADGLRVVTSGLAAGDRVVVNGVRKILFPGMPVAPTEVTMDQPDAATAPAAVPGAAAAQPAGAAKP